MDVHVKITSCALEGSRQARRPTLNRESTSSTRRQFTLLLTIAAALFCLIVGAPSTKAATTDPDVSTFDITFDDTAVRQLIALVKAKDTSEMSLDTWLNLPANKYILSVGQNEGDLTREQFRKNAVDVINGTATPDTQPLTDIGCLWMSSVQDYTAMLDAFDDSTPARVKRIAERLSEFSPKGVHIKETVYLHLGGNWDAINDHGTIYLNIRFWHDMHRPGWDGVNMIVAHETTHSVQNAVYGNPEDQSSSTPAFLTAMSKIQREGTARYVEYDTDPEAYRTSTYGFYERAISTESYRSFPTDLSLLEGVYQACYPTFDHDKFVNVYTVGMDTGGPFYDIGYGIARAIDEHLGRAALIDTIVRGPKQFYSVYEGLCESDSSLPKLPDDVVRAIAKMPMRLDDAPPAQKAN